MKALLQRRAATAWPQPDFLPPSTRAGWRAWAALLAAALASAVLGWESLQLRAQHAELAASLSVAQRLQARPAARPAGFAVARAAAGQELAARRALLGVQQQLDTDWRAPWLALEQALPAGVQLLAMDLGGDAPRLEGLAPSAQSALELGERLSASPALGPLVLTRLQAPAGADSALRFELARRPSGGLR